MITTANEVILDHNEIYSIMDGLEEMCMRQPDRDHIYYNPIYHDVYDKLEKLYKQYGETTKFRLTVIDENSDCKE